MKIYLDGCDGAGKSTLADYISKRFKIDKFCLTKDSEKSLDRYFHILTYKNVVCDRTFLSEDVYPKIFGRNKWMSQVEVNYLIKAYNNNGIIVICTAPTDVIKQRLIKRGDEFKEVLANLDVINSAYIKIANKHDILLVDTNEMSCEEICDCIERRLENGKF